MIKKIGKISKNMVLAGNFALSLGLVGVGLPVFPAHAMVQEQDSTLTEELQTLLKDYQELQAMNEDTSAIEKQISARILLLKEEIKTFIEQSFDIPITLDGELLVYEKTIQDLAEVTESDPEDENLWNQLHVQTIDGKKVYSYRKTMICRLDVDEESFMELVRFVNTKKLYPMDQLETLLSHYETAKSIHYGYRLSLFTIIDEKMNPNMNEETTIYTGTVFNNTEYSYRTDDLIKRILLKLKTDYVERTGSTFPPYEYIIRKVEGKWLIIHTKTGATDFLSEEEASVCSAVGKVQMCFDSDHLLENSKDSDAKIESMQYALEDYLEYKKKKKATSY